MPKVTISILSYVAKLYREPILLPSPLSIKPFIAMKKIFSFLALAMLLWAHVARANNIAVSNVSFTGQNISAGANHANNFVNVKFDLSWENSWRHNSLNGSLSYIGVQTGGAGYTSAPTVSISGGGGSGATATATVSGGVVTGFSITNAGSNYTSVPTITLTGGGATTAAAADAHINSWWDAAWVFIKFRVGASNPTFTGLSSSTTTITVNSTANLRVGMPVRVTSGTGAFAANTVISSITNTTQFVVSATPTTPLSSASIECIRIWEHARLNNTGHTAPSGGTIDVGLLTPSSAFNATTNPGLGVFIYRSTAGFGNNSFTGAELRWNYGANNVSDEAIVELKMFGIEMVYVPQSTFIFGSSGSELGKFTPTTINTSIFTQTYRSGTTQNKLNGTTGGGPDQLLPFLNNSTLHPNGSHPNHTLCNTTYWSHYLNCRYPNGYSAFYCMKHEVSQGLYKDFLNTLTYTQQTQRTTNAPSSSAGTCALKQNSDLIRTWVCNSNRNGLDIKTPGNATSLTPAVYGCNLDGDANFDEDVDGQFISCTNVSFPDALALLDWASLRPMTEMEYEKACRGIKPGVNGEYAWGTTSITNHGHGAYTNSGRSNETSAVTGANNADQLVNPIRCGAFATSTSTRESAGASYWGILDLSGNLAEFTITVERSTSNFYIAEPGNGQLTHLGAADPVYWLACNNGFEGALVYLRKGGQVSYRPSTGELSIREGGNGIRGVR